MCHLLITLLSLACAVSNERRRLRMKEMKTLMSNRSWCRASRAITAWCSCCRRERRQRRWRPGPGPQRRRPTHVCCAIYLRSLCVRVCTGPCILRHFPTFFVCPGLHRPMFVASSTYIRCVSGTA